MSTDLSVQDISLSELRQQIDEIDRQLVELLAERFRVTQRVGEHKRDHDLPAVDPAREAAQVTRTKELARQAGLDPDIADRLLRFLIDEVVKNHLALKQAGSER